MPSLTALPVDIFYEVCKYLFDADVFSLHAASPKISERLPASRLSKILSHRHFFIHRDDTPKLIRLAGLASQDPVRASRITHITFDLSNPNVSNLRYESVYNGVPSLIKGSRLHKWCEEYLTSVYGKDAITISGEDTTTEQELTRVYNGTMDVLASAFKPPQLHPMTTEEENSYNAAVTTLFKSLPNLTTLGFRNGRPDTPEGMHEFSRKVRGYNPFLDDFFSKAPGLEELPWMSIMSLSDSNIFLHKTFTEILSCAAQARLTKISRIYTPYNYPNGKDGVPIAALEVPLIYLILNERLKLESTLLHEASWRSAFKSLRTLDFRTVENAGNTKPSALFLAMVENVEDFTIRLSQRNYASRALNLITTYKLGVLRRRPRFVLPVDLKLPRLRKLTICHGGMAVAGFIEFLNTNKETLKEVICTGPAIWNHAVTKPEILNTLAKIRESLKLERLELDFLVNLEQNLNCCIFAIRVQAKSGWIDDNHTPGNIDIGFATWCDRIQRDGRFPPSLKRWVNASCWSSFASEFERLDAQGCERHWAGKAEEYISSYETIED